MPSDVELEVRCLEERCRRSRLYRATVPLELVSALAIAFHANHEGHPLELVIDGQRFAPGLEDLEPVRVSLQCQRHRHRGQGVERYVPLGLVPFVILDFHTAHGACPVLVQIGELEVGPT